MHDPFPLPRPDALLPYVQPVADFLHLQTLPLHFHEVAFAFTLYHCINRYAAPAISHYFLPRIYPSFNARTKLNWDVHIVSFAQSTVICGLALWVIWHDEARTSMDPRERVYGYTGASGLIQAFAGGYFLWDLVITVQNVRIFGIGMLFHAISALSVFSLGFRPFVNFYAPTFILYELSSPFLNIHWFCDKLNMTGSTVQFVNGLFLLSTFFCCRLVWGTYQSIRVFGDVYNAYHAGPIAFLDAAGTHNSTITRTNLGPETPMLRFADGQSVPLWLAAAYLASNLTLNGLNWFWFGKMIETLRKRFDPPLGTRKPEASTSAKPGITIPTLVAEDDKVLIEGTHVGTPAALAAGDEVAYFEGEGGSGGEVKEVSVQRSASGAHLEVSQSEVRTRSSTRRRG